MFNMTGLMNQVGQMQGLMQNPQRLLSEQMAAQLIRENPQQWAQAQQMFDDKSHKQQVAALRQLYRQKGLDLDAVARQYGVQL